MSNAASVTAGKHLEDLDKTIQRFGRLGVTADWVRVAVALTLIEAAMKQKLESLGHSVREYVKFDDLTKEFEQTLEQKESRRLRPQLIGLSQLHGARNKFVHTGHLYMDLPKDEADSIVNLVAGLIDDMGL